MLKIIIISLISSILVAEEVAKPQPIEVFKVLSEYEKDVVSARKAYDLLLIKAADKATTSLDKAKKSYIQKEDLNGANLVNDAIKKINEGETLTAIENNIKKNNDILGDNHDSLDKKIIGKWNALLTGINWNGLVQIDDKLVGYINNGSIKGKIAINRGSFTINWAHGYKHPDMTYNKSEDAYIGKLIMPNGSENGLVKYIRSSDGK